jgi:mono/diheme cytochrome c family protein
MSMQFRTWLAVAALAAGVGSATAQEIGQPPKGLAVAERLCADCHAIGRKEATSPNPAAPRFEAIAASRGMSATALNAALQTSHRTMPNIILEPDDLRNLIAYILSLRPGG